MTTNTRASVVVFLPVLLVGLVIGGSLLFPQQPVPPATVPVPVDEVAVVNRAIEQTSSTLPVDTLALGLAERHMLLRLNGSPQRQLEVAGGLYAVAAKHLSQANTPEAMRVAQVCADLAPGSLIAARCWMLCGDASAVTHPDLPLSIRYYERADSALRERLTQLPNEPEALRLRAVAIQWLGRTNDRFGRTEVAIQYFRELMDTPSLVQIQPPADRLRATLTLGLLLHKAGLIGQANRMLAVAQDLGKSDTVPAAEALHALMETTHVLSPEVADPARQEALRGLWDTPRFRNLPEWFQVGDELASAYFFAEPRQLADFALVSRQFLASLPQVLKSLPVGSDQQAGLESLYATNLLLAADFARDRSDTPEVSRLVALFESRYVGSDIQFISPRNRPAQWMHRIGEIYRTTMTGHIEQLRQIHATEIVPR